MVCAGSGMGTVSTEMVYVRAEMHSVSVGTGCARTDMDSVSVGMGCARAEMSSVAVGTGCAPSGTDASGLERRPSRFWPVHTAVQLIAIY